MPPPSAADGLRASEPSGLSAAATATPTSAAIASAPMPATIQLASDSEAVSVGCAGVTFVTLAYGVVFACSPATIGDGPRAGAGASRSPLGSRAAPCAAGAASAQAARPSAMPLRNRLRRLRSCRLTSAPPGIRPVSRGCGRPVEGRSTAGRDRVEPATAAPARTLPPCKPVCGAASRTRPARASARPAARRSRRRLRTRPRCARPSPSSSAT